MQTIYPLFVRCYECKDTKDILKTLDFHCYIKDYCRNLLAFTELELPFYKLELVLLIEFACECNRNSATEMQIITTHMAPCFLL